MPCMDYEYTPHNVVPDLKARLDMLSRIACKALAELEAKDPTNAIFKDTETSYWWTKHKIADAEAMARAEERAARELAADAMVAARMKKEAKVKASAVDRAVDRKKSKPKAK